MFLCAVRFCGAGRMVGNCRIILKQDARILPKHMQIRPSHQFSGERKQGVVVSEHLSQINNALVKEKMSLKEAKALEEHYDSLNHHQGYLTVKQETLLEELETKSPDTELYRRGKFGHEFMEFELSGDGKLRYANNSNYKNDVMNRKEG